MNEGTRVVHLAPWAGRTEATNGTTLVGAEIRVPSSPQPVFRRNHLEAAQAIRAESRRGVMLFALDNRGLVGRLWLAATDRLRVATVGRHSAADLHLPDGGTLALRHLAVLVRGAERVVARLLDLRTANGMADERGERLTAVSTDGPLMLGVAGYWLFLAPTGAGVPWDVEAEDPWATLPARVLLSRRNDAPHRREEEAVPRAPGPVTRVSVMSGPVELGPAGLLQRAERPEGHLLLRREGREYVMAAGKDALDRGVLLGRYSRCDGSALLQDESISRVHALVIRDEGALYLLDIGSTNGTWSGEEAVRAVELSARRDFRLAQSTTLRWEPSN